ncbi:secretory calcium-binding phosphoprotein 9 [Aulostomus maculatus]
MKILLLITFVVTISYVNAGKKQWMIAGVNGGMGNGLMAGGLNPPMVAGGGAGFAGQPQFAQFVPGLPAFAVPVPVPNTYPVSNMYPVPAINALPYVGLPQMPQMNPPQQPLGLTGGAVQLLPPLQPDLLRRFKRQTTKPANALENTVDTQIPAPPETSPAPCVGAPHQDNQ